MPGSASGPRPKAIFAAPSSATRAYSTPHLELAAVLLEQTRLPAAQEQLEQAIALAPQSASALARGRRVCCSSCSNRRRAFRRIQKAIEIDRSEALDALGFR